MKAYQADIAKFETTTSESQNIEGQHHVLLSLKVTELESHAPAVRPCGGAGEGEVRRRLSHFQIRVRRGRLGCPGRGRSWCRLLCRSDCSTCSQQEKYTEGFPNHMSVS
jgi:hypothetical protein